MIYEIEKSLNKTLDSSNLEGLTIDIAEVAFDTILDDGIFKDIPVLGSILKVAKLGLNINTLLLYKKVFKFLFQIKDITISERQLFYKKILDDEDYSKDIGEAVLLILEKLDDMEKPVIIGKLFAATIIGKLEYITFLRLAHIIEKMFLPDLEELRKVNRGIGISNEIKSVLHNVGLMSRTPFGKIQVNSSNEYRLNKNGKKIIELLYNE